MARKLWARESVGLYLSISLVDASDAPVDMTGWTLACSFARQRGATDVTLGMAASLPVDGFRLTTAASGLYTMRITATTLAAIDDETGDFTMFGDIIATTGGGDKIWLDDIELQVTEGPTA